MNPILTPDEVTNIRAEVSRAKLPSQDDRRILDLCDTVNALRDRLHVVDAEAEELTLALEIALRDLEECRPLDNGTECSIIVSRHLLQRLPERSAKASAELAHRSAALAPQKDEGPALACRIEQFSLVEFDTLLEAMEQNDRHIFLLVTEAPHQVPITIRARCMAPEKGEGGASE